MPNKVVFLNNLFFLVKFLNNLKWVVGVLIDMEGVQVRDPQNLLIKEKLLLIISTILAYVSICCYCHGFYIP